MEFQLTVISPDGNFSGSWDSEVLERVWGTTYIPPNNIFEAKDRWVSEDKNLFPVKIVDTYKLKGDDGNYYRVKFQKSIQ